MCTRAKARQRLTKTIEIRSYPSFSLSKISSRSRSSPRFLISSLSLSLSSNSNSRKKKKKEEKNDLDFRKEGGRGYDLPILVIDRSFLRNGCRCHRSRFNPIPIPPRSKALRDYRRSDTQRIYSLGGGEGGGGERGVQSLRNPQPIPFS